MFDSVIVLPFVPACIAQLAQVAHVLMGPFVSVREFDGVLVEFELIRSLKSIRAPNKYSKLTGPNSCLWAMPV